VLVLSDCPERLAGFAAVAEGSAVPVDSLPPREGALWRTLGGGVHVWRGPAPDPGPAGFWSAAVVVGEAPSSQFDALRDLLGAGLELPGPTAWVALSGRGFHGQRGRPWAALPGNLHLCPVFPEPGLAARDLPSLPMLPVVALADAVRALSRGRLRPGIKWVNDVLVDGRKVGGVLTASQTQGDRVGSVLLGIGLNVAAAPPVLPTPFVPRVGCLADTGVEATWAGAALAVMESLGRRLVAMVRDGAAPLLEEYRSASVVIGREVCIFPPEALSGPAAAASAPLARGTVLSIGADLSLTIEGLAAPVTAGRLAFAEDCPPEATSTS
jgi:BirA family transcriptional regulator, biotin operon repressor / biotin---[acetyl-CoA-carboxylase] ligase